MSNKTREIMISLSEMDLEVMWMSLVDSQNELKAKQEKWANSAATAEAKEKLAGCSNRHMARLEETKNIVEQAKRILNATP